MQNDPLRNSDDCLEGFYKLLVYPCTDDTFAVVAGREIYVHTCVKTTWWKTLKATAGNYLEVWVSQHIRKGAVLVPMCLTKCNLAKFAYPCC